MKTNAASSLDFQDDFPWSPARGAVVAVVRSYGIVQKLMEPYFARFGLTPPQFQMLTVANRLRGESLTQRRLARELYVSFTTVTIMLARLEKAGLVERHADADDRRAKLVRVSVRGRALLRRVWRFHQRQLDRVMKGLTVEEQKVLSLLLNKMIQAHL